MTQDIGRGVSALELEVAMIRREPAINYINYFDPSVVELKLSWRVLAELVGRAFDADLHAANIILMQ